MTEAPPTSPNIALPARVTPTNPKLVGSAIAAGCVFIACWAVPLAMASNIWPIAGVFWSVLTIPVAAGLGALAGWLARRTRPNAALGILVGTGVALAIAVGFLIANNR